MTKDRAIALLLKASARFMKAQGKADAARGRFEKSAERVRLINLGYKVR